jgi:uncharacterized Zn-binding protein involved in type VI secretion
MPPAARLTDMHVCPMVTPGVPPIPHVGGPITGPGAPTILIGGMPAATVGDMCVCRATGCDSSARFAGGIDRGSPRGTSRRYDCPWRGNRGTRMPHHPNRPLKFARELI